MRLDLGPVNGECIEVFRLTEPSEQRVYGQSKQTETARPMRQIQAKLTTVQMRTSADPKSGHHIFVVANEQKRSPAVEFLAFDTDAQAQKRKAPKREHGRPGER